MLPVWFEIPIAVLLGYMVYKHGKSVTLWSIYAIIAMYATVIIGVYAPIKLPVIAGMPATGTWSIILLTYAFIASVLPVTTLLQPRDFINSHQLIVAMVLLVLGVFIASFSGNLSIVAPTVQMNPAKAPPMWPFLFITIACGAISGFHSLVSSGTSAKQVANEKDALFVGIRFHAFGRHPGNIGRDRHRSGNRHGICQRRTNPHRCRRMVDSLCILGRLRPGLGSKIDAFVVGGGQHDIDDRNSSYLGGCCYGRFRRFFRRNDPRLRHKNSTIYRLRNCSLILISTFSKIAMSPLLSLSLQQPSWPS